MSLVPTSFQRHTKKLPTNLTCLLSCNTLSTLRNATIWILYLHRWGNDTVRRRVRISKYGRRDGGRGAQTVACVVSSLRFFIPSSSSPNISKPCGRNSQVFLCDSIGYEDVPANISSSHICFFSVPERCHVLFDVDPLPALSLYILFASYYETCALTYPTCAPRPIPAEVPGEVPGVIARIAFTWLYAMREYLGINVIILDLRGIIVFQNVGIS